MTYRRTRQGSWKVLNDSGCTPLGPTHGSLLTEEEFLKKQMYLCLYTRSKAPTASSKDTISISSGNIPLTSNTLLPTSNTQHISTSTTSTSSSGTQEQGACRNQLQGVRRTHLQSFLTKEVDLLKVTSPTHALGPSAPTSPVISKFNENENIPSSFTASSVVSLSWRPTHLQENPCDAMLNDALPSPPASPLKSKIWNNASQAQLRYTLRTPGPLALVTEVLHQWKNG